VTSMSGSSIDGAAAMRHAFDASFAEAPDLTSDVFENLLAIRVGLNPYALRIEEVSGLYVDTLVVSLPGAPPALLGIAGFRSAIVAVYDLGVLLGGRGGEMCRWLALAVSESTIGLAFNEFEGLLRVPRDSIAVETGTHLTSRTSRQIVNFGASSRSIVRVADLVEAIKTPATVVRRSDDR